MNSASKSSVSNATNPVRVALLEDDKDQAEMIGMWLQGAGFDVSTVHTGGDMKDLLKSNEIDLMILDWGLPDISGVELLSWVRSHFSWPIPVLFLTARSAEHDIVGALESGADDFVTKPAQKDEFLARVKAVARRSGVLDSRANEMQIGRYLLRREGGVIKMDGEVVSTTAREFELAWYLFARRGQILPREKIYQAVWGATEVVQTRTIDTHMSRIRKKLELRPENGWHLSSVYHYGYRLEQLGS